MQFKKNVFYIDDAALLKTLSEYGRGPSSKDYEYIVSILAKRLFEQKFKQPFTIVFEVKGDQKVKSGNVKLTTQEANNILRNFLEENTSVDFGLAAGTPGNFKGYAYPFQVKRFISKSIEQMEMELIEFINLKSKHYKDQNLSLIFIPELPDNSEHRTVIKKVSITNIQKGLNLTKDSLRSIFLLEMFKGKERLIQVWPNIRDS